MTTNVMNLNAARVHRARAHECPACHGSWSVHASHHPSGAWLLTCTFCEWHQVILPAGADDAWFPLPSAAS